MGGVYSINFNEHMDTKISKIRQEIAYESTNKDQ